MQHENEIDFVMEGFMFFPIVLTRSISESVDFYNYLLNFPHFTCYSNSFLFENYQIHLKHYAGDYLNCSVFLSCQSFLQVCARARKMDCIVQYNKKGIKIKDNNCNSIFICGEENNNEK